MASSGWVGRERNGLRGVAAADVAVGRSEALRLASFEDLAIRLPKAPLGRFDMINNLSIIQKGAMSTNGPLQLFAFYVLLCSDQEQRLPGRPAIEIHADSTSGTGT